ncbi:neuroblast differentiation-associated protein AHNAK-like [Melanotaenia boesemani]|uniref:neuroblast differentiation-associated protein AHNAK-like n=1 Tax=Melanotaenia boesemani TaxID=1250792 RepID=UPI001C05DF11|nr:neuroblast differentiation-associated protein AHNAK-like [Melanotaenia boesemani]
MFERRSTPKMSKLKEVPSPEAEVIVKTAKDGCAEGLVYGGGGKEGIFIKEVVPESPASKSLKVKEGDQLLSATVYFDNVSYEDAIQILEHAQAYKVKLCLKRKPDITEMEPAIESDVIHEEEVYPTEGREQGKTKRRGDARISWPKFPSFGKGRKSRFTRSHSSSEADEQRKLELSPTTSDTESPIKSQDALKGKKKHKIKLSALTKRGRISSSEDQDTDAPTTGQISGDIPLTQESDMLSPESLEGPSGESAEVKVTEDLKVEEDLRPEQNNLILTDAQSVQHKVELISIDSTLKTTDLTVALADQASPSDGKKKKKEKSELKIKILGKDKSHKKDAKAKASPKRLKALGASIEKEGQPEAEKSDVISSFESHTDKQGDQAALEASMTKQSATEDAKTKDDPYETLSKIRVSTTQLPKREDIEIPGMEDMSKIKAASEIPESKADFTGHSDESHSETVQLLIDVNSVKQAVSKLPGYKLPQVDTSGVPVLEEITVIDANAQRISVKTPTKVAEPKAKHEALLTRFDITSLEISKVKVSKITPADLTAEEHLTETKTEKEHKTKTKESDKEAKTEAPQAASTVQDQDTAKTNGADVIKSECESAATKELTKKSKKTKITMPSFGITTPEIRIPDFGIDLPKQNITLQKGFQSKTETKKEKKQTGEAICDAKISEATEDLIDEAGSISFPEFSSGEKDIKNVGDVDAAPSDIDENVTSGEKDVNIDGAEVKTLEREGKGSKFKLPHLSISVPKVKGTKFDLSTTKKDVSATAEVQLPEAPEVDVTLGSESVCIPEQKMEAEAPEVEIKPLETQCELDGQGSKLKMPKFGIKLPKFKGPEFDLSLSKKDEDVKLPEAEAEIHQADVSLGRMDASVPEQTKDVDKPEAEAKPLSVEGELDGSKLKMPKFGIKIPKIKSSDFELSLSSKDGGIKMPETRTEVRIPKAPEADESLGRVDPDISEQKIDAEKSEIEIKAWETQSELHGQGSRFKMPKFGIKMPKFKGPEFDLHLSKKDEEDTLQQDKAEVQIPTEYETDVTLGKLDVTIPEKKMDAEKPELEIKPVQAEVEADVQGGKFKKPKFGIKMPKIKGPELDISLSKKEGGVTLSEAKADAQLPETDVSINISVPEPKITLEKPELEIKPVQAEGEFDGRSHKFKMPKFGISVPKVKGPEIDLSLSKEDEDITWPEANGKVKITDAEIEDSAAKVEIRAPETPDVKVGSLDVKTKAAEVDEKAKFKMPKFGISLPKLKGPAMDLSLSKKDVDLSLPEAEADVKPDVKEDGKTHDIPDVERSASAKFQMRTFEVPKPQAESPKISVEISGMDKDVKIDGAYITAPEEGLTVGIKAPSAEVETTGRELDVKGSKFKMPHLGFAMPKVKGPKIDPSKKEAGTTLPEAKTDVKLPKADLEKVDFSVQRVIVDIEKPELEMEALDFEGQPDGEKDKTKMPKFGIKLPKVKGPEFHFGVSKKAGDVLAPEAKADINLPDVEPKAPSTEVEMTAPETPADDTERSSSTFKMPDISFSMPKVKLQDANLSLPSKETEVTLPQAEAEMEIPEVSKAEVSLGKAEIMIPEGQVEAEKPEIQIKPLQTQVKQEGRFKMPKLGITMPKVKGTEIDLNLSKEDTEGTLVESKAEVKMPGPEFKESSAKVEIKTPEMQDQLSHVEQSPSKFKIPTLKFPKFRAAVSADAPDLDKETKIEEPTFKIPKDGAEVDIVPQKNNAEAESLNVKVTGSEGEGKESKFKFPKFGISLPTVQGSDKDLSLSKKDVKLPKGKADVQLPEGPEIYVNLRKKDVSIPEASIEIKKPEMKQLQSDGELDGQALKFKTATFGEAKLEEPQTDFGSSKTDVHVPLPEVKAEVSLPGVDIKEPSAVVEVKAAQIEPQSTSMKGSPSKFKLPTFKFPKFGVTTPNVSAEVPNTEKEIKLDGADVEACMPCADVDVPEVKAEVHLPDLEVKSPSSSVVIGQQQDVEVDAKSKKSRFSMPKFSFSKPSVKASEVDISFPEVELPEGKVEVKVGGEMAMEPPEIKMQKELKPEIEFSLSKGEGEGVALPEAKVKLPDVELEKPILEVEAKAPEIKVVTKTVEGSPSKFKMPTFKLPKFGLGTPTSTVEVPASDEDVHIDGTDIKIPEEVLAVTIDAFGTDFEAPSTEIKTVETEHEGKGSKFKLPSLGFTVPPTKGPDVDLSLSKPDVDVALPEIKAEVKLPQAELIKMSAEVEAKAPEITVIAKEAEGSPSKFKMPTFKLPKFGIGTSSATAEVPALEKDVKTEMSEEVLAVTITAPGIETKDGTLDIKTARIEHEGKVSKFKLPSLGVSVPKAKGPDIDFSLTKTDVDLTLPEAEAKVQVPDVKLQKPSAGPPEIKTVTKDSEKSSLKFKMPSFKLPKFGVGTTSATVEEPNLDKDEADIRLPEGALAVNITAPNIDTEPSTVDMKITETELEGKGSKFKLPSLGFTVPPTKGPDVDLSLSKPDVDVALPEIKAEVKLPQAELIKMSAEVEAKAPGVKVVTKEAEGSPSKFKMPTFKLPKFGIGTPSATAEVPALEKDVKTEMSEEVLAVTITAPGIETKDATLDIKTARIEHEGKVSKFKLPSLGVSVPKAKGPDIDFSLTKKDVDLTLPEAEAKVQLSDVKLQKPSVDVEAKAPEIKVITKEAKGSPSKFKMPTFKLPKFGIGAPSSSVEVPALDKDIKTEISDEVLAVTIPAPNIEAEGPSVEIKTTKTEHGSKFKLPSLGFSAPQAKEPDVDLSLPKTDVDVTLPEAEAEVQLSDVKLQKPSIDVEAKAPEIKVITKEAEGSPSKFKMPTFKLPKFGIGAPSSSVEVPALDKDIKTEISDEVLAVTIPAPSTEAEGPSVEIKTTGTEYESKGSKFKLPSLGFSAPQAKGPDVDLSLTKTDVDVTLPEVKTEVQLSDVKLQKPSIDVEAKAPEIKVITKDTEGSPSKFKMPTFKLPKFGIGAPSSSVEVPALDKDIKTEISDEVLALTIPAPNIEAEGPSVEIKTTGTEHESKGSKFKLPSLGFSAPQAKGPDVDLSLTKTDVDVTLPEIKTEVQLSDVKLQKPSIDVEAKAPEIKVITKDTEGSPSKFKMPTFKLPKFGIGAPSSSVEVPALDKDIKTEISDEVLALTIPAPNIEAEGPSVEIKTTGTEHESKGSKFKLPSLGFSAPQAKGPDVDLSLTKTDVDVTLPEIKTEVQLPDVKLQKPSIDVEAKAPEIKVITKEAEGSPSKFKMPTFKLPKFGIGTPSTTVEVPALEKDVKTEMSEEVLAVTITAPGIETKDATLDIKTARIEQEGKVSKFKLPSLGVSVPKAKGPDIDFSLTKTDVDLTLPEAEAKVQLPDVKLQKPSVDVEAKAPEIKVITKDTEGSPSKFKMPTFKLPKFGIGAPSSSIEVPALDKDIKTEISNEVLAVTIPAPNIEAEGPSVEIKTTGTEHEKGRKFKLPSLGFSAPQAKGPDVDLSLTKTDVDVTLPEVKTEVKLTDAELKKPYVEVENEALDIDMQESKTEGSPSKFKIPSFKLPKFGASVEMPDIDKNIKVEETKTEVKLPDVETKEPAGSVEGDIKGRKTSWTLPRFSFSKTNTKALETDISLEVEGTKTDAHAADTDIKETSGTSVDGRTTTDLDAKLKRPRFSLPRFSFSKQGTKGPEVESSQVNVDVSLPEGQAECETDLDGQESRFKIPKFGITMPKVKDVDFSREDVDTTLPEIKAEAQLPDVEIKPPSADVKIKAEAGGDEGSPSKFKMPTITLPKFGAATPQLSVEAPDVNNYSTGSLSVVVKSTEGDLKKDVDVTLPEAELQTAVSAPDVPTVEAEAQLKRPSWTFPKISLSKTDSKAPDLDINLETPKVDVTAPETKAETSLPDTDVKPSEATSLEESSAPELDTSLKKSKFSLPRFSFSKSSSKELEVKVEAPHVDVGVKTEHHEIKLRGPEVEADDRGPKGPEVALTSSDVKTSEGETDVDVKSKDVKTSPLKFKMPTLKMPKFGSASYDVTSEEKLAETDETKLKDDSGVTIKDTNTDAKTDATKAEILNSETPKTETDGAAHGSPSKFKLPSFKMPRLSFSKPKPEEDVLADSEYKKDQPEIEAEQKTESNSSKSSLISFGEILKAIDVEFDVPKIEKVEENLETSKEVCETDEASGKHSGAKEKDVKSKQEAAISPERTGWFKFPKFGLSSPSEPPKIPEKGEQKDEKSPEGEIGDEEISPTGSVQSSDAFADISSTIASEPVGLSLSSPTKVTVKYSEPPAAVGPGDMHGDFITTRTELISDVPYLPEKITIPSSGVSSSSEDTIRLESGKIHIITSNIQATPETQHTKLLTAIQIQSAGGLDVKSEGKEAASWTVGDSQSGKTTVFERHLVQEMSTERSESKETIVITKQVTHVLEKSEPISGETASSIQRLKDSVHTEKMRFFDEAEK